MTMGPGPPGPRRPHRRITRNIPRENDLRMAERAEISPTPSMEAYPWYSDAVALRAKSKPPKPSLLPESVKNSVLSGGLEQGVESACFGRSLLGSSGSDFGYDSLFDSPRSSFSSHSSGYGLEQNMPHSGSNSPYYGLPGSASNSPSFGYDSNNSPRSQMNSPSFGYDSICSPSRSDSSSPSLSYGPEHSEPRSRSNSPFSNQSSNHNIPRSSSNSPGSGHDSIFSSPRSSSNPIHLDPFGLNSNPRGSATSNCSFDPHGSVASNYYVIPFSNHGSGRSSGSNTDYEDRFGLPYQRGGSGYEADRESRSRSGSFGDRLPWERR